MGAAITPNTSHSHTMHYHRGVVTQTSPACIMGAGVHGRESDPNAEAQDSGLPQVLPHTDAEDVKIPIRASSMRDVCTEDRCPHSLHPLTPPGYPLLPLHPPPPPTREGSKAGEVSRGSTPGSAPRCTAPDSSPALRHGSRRAPGSTHTAHTPHPSLGSAQGDASHAACTVSGAGMGACTQHEEAI